MRRPALLCTALAVAAALAACAGGGGDGPSPEQAEQLLGHFYELSQQTRDANVFCRDEAVYSTEMCQTHWRWAGGPDSIPTERPRVLASKVEKSQDLVALRVCGVDGLGRPYQGDFVIEQAGERITVPLPIYWEGIDYSGTYEDGKPPPLAGARGSGPKERIGCP